MKAAFGFSLVLISTMFLYATTSEAQVTANNLTTCRLIDEPSGARNDNNGGADGSTLIGVNSGLVDNVLVYQMDLSPLAGTQTSGATVTINVNQGWNPTNGVHGSTADTIALFYCFGTNSGFDSGSSDGMNVISAADNQEDDGAISYLNRVQFDQSGTTEPWMDATGAAVADLGAAIVQISTTTGYDQGAAPAQLEFTVDQATAQLMLDDGIAAFVVRSVDDGNGSGRFFLRGGSDAVTITFEEGTSGGSVPPASFSVFRGIQLSGVLTDFETSDDVRATYNPGFTISNVEAPIWLIFDAVAPSATEFFVESQAGTPGLTYTVEAFDWTTQSYTEIGVEAETFGSDTVSAFPIAAANIDVGGEVRSRVGWRRTGFTINFPWEARVDQVGWNQ